MRPRDRHCRTESNTSFSPPPCKHLWGLLGSIPQQGERVFLPLRPFPSVLGLPRRVATSVRHALGGWVCAAVSDCFATAQTHAPPLLPPPWGPTGWKAKKLPSLLSTLWAIWTNLFPTTYFILVKHLHHLVTVNLSHIFLLKMEYGVGRKSKPIWAGPQQAVHFGSSGKSKHCSLLPLSTHSSKAKAGNGYATWLASSW